MELFAIVASTDGPGRPEGVRPNGELKFEPSRVLQGSRLELGGRARRRAEPRMSGALRASAIFLTDAPGGEQALQLLEQLQPALTGARRWQRAHFGQDAGDQRQLRGIVIDAHD